LNTYRWSGYIKESIIGAFSSGSGLAVNDLCLMEQSDINRPEILDDEDEG
jgi:hypothetical protein